MCGHYPLTALTATHLRFLGTRHLAAAEAAFGYSIAMRSSLASASGSAHGISIPGDASRPRTPGTNPGPPSSARASGFAALNLYIEVGRDRAAFCLCIFARIAPFNAFTMAVQSMGFGQNPDYVFGSCCRKLGRNRISNLALNGAAKSASQALAISSAMADTGPPYIDNPKCLMRLPENSRRNLRFGAFTPPALVANTMLKFALHTLQPGPWALSSRIQAFQANQNVSSKRRMSLR